MPLPPETLARLRELATKATPGPWKPSVWIETDGNEWRATGPAHEDFASDHGSEPGSPDEQAAQRDAAFIAAADPTTVVELLDEIERLHGLLSGRTMSCSLCNATAAQLAAVEAARDELVEIATELIGDCMKQWPHTRQRITELAKAGAAK